ncbi:MAG: hypothetical protein ABSG02_21115 [Terriglobales bacterium]
MILDQKYVESAAYHEAAHTVVAVTLGMPLRNRGVHMDTFGSGISYYWFRIPGDLSNTPDDILERERTIISTYAGFIAQKKVYPECPPAGSWFDSDQNIKLLDELYPDRNDWFAAQERLFAEAVRLVDFHRRAIETLAKALLAQPLVARPDDPERRWSMDAVERLLDGSSVVAILRGFGLNPVIREDSAH